MDEDGTVKLSDLARLKKYISRVITSLNSNIKHDPSVDAFISVAEFLFSELDKETIMVGDKLNNDDFKEIAGEDSDIYKNSNSSNNPAPDMKPGV